MSDDNKNDKSSEKPAPATGGSGKWSTGAKPLPKYENEPDYDDGEDYGEEE